MNWRRQQDKVERLAGQAQADAHAMAMHRLALRKWSQQTFGSPQALAWWFAAGTAWGLARRTETSRSRAQSKAVAAANTLLFAWRVAHTRAP